MGNVNPPPPTTTATLLAVTNSTNGTIDVLSIDTQTGALVEVVGSPYAAGRNTSAIVVAGRYVYAANTAGGRIGRRPDGHPPIRIGIATE